MLKSKALAARDRSPYNPTTLVLDHVLQTKFHLPSIRSGTVPRERLICLLDERTGIARGFDRSIILMSAPAGFGKTTLTAQWIRPWREADRLLSWLSLDEGESDPRRLLVHLTRALEALSPRIDPALIPVLDSQEPPPTDVYLTTLINRLTLEEHCSILVLDDVHRLDSTESMEVIAFLVNHLPARVCLVLLTREDPALPLGRLRSSGRLTELRAADLRFTTSETSSLLNGAMELDLSPNSVSSLDRRTEGWVAGLQMAALSLRGMEQPEEFVDAFAGSHRFVFDYLAEEVLERLADTAREFLLRISVLDTLSGPVCDALTGRHDGAEMLEELDRSNVFLAPVDDSRTWYRCHQLFAEVLRRILRSTYPDAEPELHARASRWFESADMPESALGHGYASSDREAFASLAERLWASMDSTFQVRGWLHWVMKLSTAEILSRPELAFRCAESLSDVGEAERSEKILRGIEVSLRSSGLPAGSGIADATTRSAQGRIALLRADNCQVVKDLEGAVAFAEEAIELLPDDDPTLMARAVLARDFPSWSWGEADRAELAFRRWISDMSAAGAETFALASTYPLAEILAVRGRLGAAIREVEFALERSGASGDGVAGFAAHLHLLMAMLQHERDERQSRDHHLERARVLSPHDTLVDWPYRWNVARARVFESEKKWEAALDLLREAKGLFVRNPTPNTKPVTAMIADLNVRRGALEDAARWARQYQAHRPSAPGYMHEYEEMTLARFNLAEFQTMPNATRLETASERIHAVAEVAKKQERFGSLIDITIVEAALEATLGRHENALGLIERALTYAAPERWIRPFLDAPPTIHSLLVRLDEESGPGVFAGQILEALGKTDESPERGGESFGLSTRELEVLAALDSGQTGPQLAERFYVSLNTFRTHTKSIYSKLDVNSRYAAVQKARKLGIL